MLLKQRASTLQIASLLSLLSLLRCYRCYRRYRRCAASLIHRASQ